MTRFDQVRTYDFPLVIRSNSGPISSRIRDKRRNVCRQNADFSCRALVFDALVRGEGLNYGKPFELKTAVMSLPGIATSLILCTTVSNFRYNMDGYRKDGLTEISNQYRSSER